MTSVLFTSLARSVGLSRLGGRISPQKIPIGAWRRVSCALPPVLSLLKMSSGLGGAVCGGAGEWEHHVGVAVEGLAALLQLALVRERRAQWRLGLCRHAQNRHQSIGDVLNSKLPHRGLSRLDVLRGSMRFFG